MRDLRARCDWDAAQTHESLRPYLIEEAYEVDEAIRSGDDAKLREELGDLLLQVLFHSIVAEERKAFDIGDVAETFVTKMKGRHPHLYGDGGAGPSSWSRRSRPRLRCRTLCAPRPRWNGRVPGATGRRALLAAWRHPRIESLRPLRRLPRSDTVAAIRG